MSDNQNAPQHQDARETVGYPGPAYYRDDEISLIDLWNVLIRRKWMIAGAMVLCVLAAIMYSMVATPVYESRTVVLIGKVATIGPVENPDEMVQRLLQAYKVGDDTEGGREMPYVEAISLNKRDADHVLTISARAETSQEASRFLSEVVEELLSEHQVWFDQATAVLKGRLDTLNALTRAFESHIVTIQDELNTVRKIDPVQASVMAVESGKLIAQLPDMEERRVNLELNLLDSRSYPTSLLRAPTLTVKPIQPRPKLYVAIALVLGLMLGIFAAFFAEFLKNARTSTS